LEFETELRSMGVKSNTNEQKTETSKYEVIIWHGMTDGAMLRLAGIDVPEDKVSDNIDAEIWMIGDDVIKATLNPWASLDVDVKTLHTFLFDEDDTSPIGMGLPVIMRDSQMAICAASRMLLDNASVICGPNLELNTDLLRPDQDLTSTSAYKMWYREGTGNDASQPAVKNIQIDGHLPELQNIMKLYMDIADQETFVGPATGGDMTQQSSEPMRTAAGASMIRSDSALPFKDIVRSFDSMTQSILESMVQFNRALNPSLMAEADYNVIARGATSLVAKEVRGLQIDQMAATLQNSPEEKQEIDFRKFTKARFEVRDMGDMLVSQEESDRRQAANQASQASQADQAQKLAEATLRKLLSDSYKNIAAGAKNQSAANATDVETALMVLERGLSGMAGGDTSGQTGGQDPTQTPQSGTTDSALPAAGGTPSGDGVAPDQT
jgi:ribosomal protein L22